MKSIIVLLAAATMTASTFADNGNHNGNGSPHAVAYEVTITNITQNQSFTPIFAATHTRDISFYELGGVPSQDIADLAEGGAFGGLQATLEGLPQYAFDNANTAPGLVGPGESRTIMVYGSRKFDRLSLAGMLLPTNDTFVAINSMELPRTYASRLALAYDAGSEENDESCANIPGPQCGGAGEPFSEGLYEGYVHISRGISGNGDLAPEAYDWRNPVAQLTVRRVD